MRAIFAILLLLVALVTVSAAEAQDVGAPPDSCVSQVDVTIHRSIEDFAEDFNACDWVCGPSEQQRWARELLLRAQAQPLLSSYLASIAIERGFPLEGWTVGVSPPELQRQQEVYNFYVPFLFWYPDSEMLPTRFAQLTCGSSGRARFGPRYGPHNRFAVILHGAVSSESEANSRAAQASRVPGYADGGVGVLYSTDYENLTPGHWVVWAIGAPTQEDTARLAEKWRARGYAGAYSRWLGGHRIY